MIFRYDFNANRPSGVSFASVRGTLSTNSFVIST